MKLRRRTLSALGTMALCLAFAGSVTLSSVAPALSAGGWRGTPLYTLTLPQGRTAKVYSDGVAQIYDPHDRSYTYRMIPYANPYANAGKTAGLPDQGHLIAALAQDAPSAFENGRVVVVFRPGTGPTQDVESIGLSDLLSYRTARSYAEKARSIPRYTDDATMNSALAAVGADRLERLFRVVTKGMLASMRESAQSRVGHPLLAIENAYRVHITSASVHDAVQALRRLPNVEYASPDWHVSAMHTSSVELSAGSASFRPTLRDFIRSKTGQRRSISPNSLPTNYALSASAQSLLNTPGVNAAEAFDLIAGQYGQLPGQGVRITNVSEGDLDDASAISNQSDPCSFFVSIFGPTTEIIGGQRYLNMPSMPLIPAFTADDSGNTSGTGEVCRVDPFLTEVGLDFSMMAPLPDSLQRPGETGSGLSDLLGIAPGANYRLVVPGASRPTITDIDGALLAAALQAPRPDVITASLGFGFDTFGFPTRYLENDPLSLAIITSLVQNYNIVVCIAAGDGTRLSTTVAIGPSGGSAPTDTVASGGQPSDLNDIEFSTVPSLVFDSGSIDAGGTTLDDIFSAEPQYLGSTFLAEQHAFAETRWTGFTSFSSGFGSRVNVSAPSDNVLGLEHSFRGADDAVDVVLDGGTSASAPEAAAAAAVAIQVARLTGRPFASATAVREFLEQTGEAVPNVAQADRPLLVGPQIDVGRAVATLFSRDGITIPANIARVAVEQRRNMGNLDGVFQTDTDPTNINLQGPGTSDLNRRAWITIAPDWEGTGAVGTSYVLHITGNAAKVLARSKWARLQPDAILAAAGKPVTFSSSRTVSLTYSALRGATVIASANFDLTFGPDDATTQAVLAPHVPEVVSGPVIPVTYDLAHVANVSSPQLIVSEPGRVDPATGLLFHTAYSTPLTATSGTVNVPVSALHGGGIYGIGINFGTSNGQPLYSDFAFTRFAPGGSARPAAPTLSYGGSTPSHDLEIPYNSSFQLNWDVSNVPGATGAAVEISAAGPTSFLNYNPFNNPNGSQRDDNGLDFGSVSYRTLPGVSGSINLNGVSLGLIPTMNHVVRIVPLNSGGKAGEAGDVSTISMDGVKTADGGSIDNLGGYGIDAKGDDGFLVSTQYGPGINDGPIFSSLETFKQSTNAVQQTVGSFGPGSQFFTNGWGVYGNDIGLFGQESITVSNGLILSSNITYNLLNPASGSVGAAWTPPSNLQIYEGVVNQANDLATFLNVDLAAAPTDLYRVYTSNITKNTFGPVYDVSGPFSSFGSPDIQDMAVNTNTRVGVLAGIDINNFCGAPTVEKLNLATGSYTSFTGLGFGIPGGVAVDSATNRALIQTFCDNGLSIYDMATNAGSEVPMPGFGGYYPIADPTRNRFLILQVNPQDELSNNNSMSTILVYDENGRLVKTIERFFLFDIGVGGGSNELQLNTATKTGYMFGPFANQLEPFSY